MFNHLPHSDHERHARQSTSSGLRRLNRGNCCTQKISLPYSSKFCQASPQMVQSLLKGYTVNHPPKPVKLGFWLLQRNWGFQGLNQVTYAHIHCQAPTCQVSRLTRSSCTVKNPIYSTINCRGKMVIWQSKVKIFGQHLILKPQSSFGQVLTMISQEWLKNHQGVKSFYFWTAEKSIVTWPKHNFFMVYQKNPIQSSFLRGRHFLQLIFTLQVQEMLSQKVINFNIIGHFQKSTKRHFKSKTITWDW